MRKQKASLKDRFTELEQHVKQVGPSCVATTLSMVANATEHTTPEDFKSVTNSQAPHTWSQALKPYGLQLAYCNNDVRRLSYFIDELVFDDLFSFSSIHRTLLRTRRHRKLHGSHRHPSQGHHLRHGQIAVQRRGGSR